MKISILNSGFSTLGMFGNNHKLVLVDGVPSFYTCTSPVDATDHRLFILESGKQISNFLKQELDFTWLSENIEKIMGQKKHDKSKVYIYCKTTTGMIVRPGKESFSWDVPSFDSGSSNDAFDRDSDLYLKIVHNIVNNDEIESFWFVDSVTGERL